ncbi:MAG: NAD(P)/FAD-dependent oxidoreductase [bacterium]|nr:monooxygenase [Deltaproteobacteria bacterium]MCP4905488.1 NAD(P)/FAD-dependent oxidoreductase [bacterium]
METEKEDNLRFVIIGAGMAGILSAIKLEEAGLHNVTLYEKAERLGGTWRENTYPGIACDVPSHLYSYSFAPNPEWSHQYSPGVEIQRYFEDVASQFGIGDRIRFGEEIERCEFVDSRWKLRTRAGRRDEADFIIAATGVLHHPNNPEIEGLEDFDGALFHSARWDHDVPLDGKKIGVIGTGSTGVQITSALADRAQKFSLFQRTAQWVMPQENPAYSEAEKKEFREHPEQLRILHQAISKLFAASFANAIVDADSDLMKEIEAQCLLNLEQSVSDPGLRERLRPNYRAACKRLVISPDFYEAIQKPRVELVTDGIRSVEPGGVRTVDGGFHELDVLVMATGFRADRFMRPMEIIGRTGKRLDEVWADRPSAYLSISIPDLPNFFMLNGPNGPVGNFSLIEVAELQFKYILQLVDQVRAGECRSLSASDVATQVFDRERVEAAKKTIWSTGCRSWYLDDRGIPATWPWTFDRFREAMSEPDLAAYDFFFT